RSGLHRLPRLLLSALADAAAGYARRHRVRRVDGMRRRDRRGRGEVPLRRTADLADGPWDRADRRWRADYRDARRRGLSATANTIAATPASGTARSPTRRLVASATSPMTGGDEMD